MPAFENDRLRLLAIVNHSEDLISVVDQDLRLTFANTKFFTHCRKNYGFAVKLGTRVLEVCPLANSDEMRNVYQRAFRGESFTQVFRFVLGDQRVKYYETAFSPLMNQEGVVVEVSAVARDVTQRCLDQEKMTWIRESLSLSHSISKVGYWEYYPTKNRIWVSKEFLDLLRVSCLSSDGMWNSIESHTARTYFPQDLERVRQKIGETVSMVALNPDFSCTHLFRVKRSDDKAEYMEMNILRKPGQELILQGVAQIVTDRVMKEQEIEQAKAEAENALRSKREFLAIMSHEIRTPLNGVLGMAQLLAQSPLNQEQQELAEILQGCGMALMQVINDTLDFSKLEAGRLELENHPFELNESLDEVVKLFRHMALKKGLELTLDTHASPITFVLGDGPKLRQAILNLVSNALKFTQRGHIVIQVKALPVTEKFNLQISVTDSGPGMDRASAEKLFTPYQQLGESRLKRAGGTGLGLFITKGIIDAMGGAIAVESELGKGTIISIKLDLPAVNWTPVLKAPVKTENLNHRLLGQEYPMSILVVDDNEVNLKMAKACLRKCGFEADTALDGNEATQMAEAKDYQLILMDLEMPLCDGFEATRKIRNLTSSPTQRAVIVAMTAHCGGEELKDCLAVGMQDVLYKPYKICDFETLLRKWSHPDNRDVEIFHCQ